MIFERVLVPVDLTEVSFDQVDCIMQLRNFGMKGLVLLHVTLGGKLGEEQKGRMDALVKKIECDGLETRVLVVDGNPSDMVLRVAKKERCTMIAMASSGKTKAKELIVGSVSLEVVRSSKIPVLIGKYAGPAKVDKAVCTSILDRVLISLDLGPSTKHMMKAFKDIDEAGCKKAMLFHVVPSSKYSVEDGIKFENVKRELATWREAHKTKCSVDTHVHYGSPAYNILEAAREIDATLIVMGNVGKGLLHSMTLGSVSDEVLRTSAVHVLIIPC